MKYLDVIINNFNRCYSLKRLLDWLMNEALGIGKIHIIDNQSDYPPTLELYRQLGDRVYIHYLNENKGHHALHYYCSNYLKSNQRYIISDPDLYPTHNCPKDLVPYLDSLMDEYNNVEKVGVGLSLDLPDHYPLKKMVTLWEKNLIRGETPCKKGYFCSVDTTFCLIRNKNVWSAMGNHIRTKSPYLFVHADWTIDPKNLNEEYKYYYQTANSSASYLMKLKQTASFFDEVKKHKSLSFDEDNFNNIVVDRKYRIDNHRDNSYTILEFFSKNRCCQWNLNSEYEVISDSACIIYNSAGNFAYDLLLFYDNYKVIKGVNSEGAILEGKLVLDYQYEDEISKMLIGKKFIMKNLSHKSETIITFQEGGMCDAWNIQGNKFKIIENKKVMITYKEGNKSIDEIEFNEDYSKFFGRSSFGWEILGNLIK